MMKAIWIYLLLSLSFSEMAFSAVRYLCRIPGESRVISTQTDGPNCLTKYTKKGEEKIVGSGQFLNSCAKIQSSIKSNLEAAGWKCKDISSTSTSSENVD